MKIAGKGILLRDFLESDFPFYNKLEQNPLIYKHGRNAPDLIQIQNEFQTVLSDLNNNPRERYKLAVCLKHDWDLMGRVSIKLNWPERREWEIGWALHPNFWRK